MISNWQKEYITDIKYVSNSDQCPEDYSENIINYYWPGTKNGCDCFIYPEIIKGQCCNLNDKYCKSCYGIDIYHLEENNFTTWGVGPLKSAIKLCVKRIKNYSFYQKVPLEDKCNINEKKCYSQSGFDNYMFCVPNSEPCPIRSIKFELNGVVDQDYQDSVDLPNGIKLLISRTLNKNPISEFYIGEGDNVCINTLVKLSNKDRSPYILLKNYDECQMLDNRWEKIDQLDEITFFTINQMKNEIEKNLPHFEFNNKYYYSLFQRSYIQLDFQCRNYLTKFSSNQQIIDQNVDISIALIVFFSIFLFYLISYEIKYQIQFLQLLKNPEYFIHHFYYVDYQELQQKMIGMFILKWILLLALGITINMSFDKSLQIQAFIDEILQQNCVDNITQISFNKLKQLFQYKFINVLFSFWLITTITEPYALFYVWLFFKKKNNKVAGQQ